MKTSNTRAFATAMADQIIAQRFAVAYGVRTLPDYLDLVDARSTSHLTPHLADHNIRTAGQQRRKMGLTVQDGKLIAKMAMNNPMANRTVYAEIEFGVLLDLLEMGVTNAWTYNIKGPTRAAGQVITKRPMGQHRHVPVARIIANAKAGQQARTRDKNPLNLRRSNLYILGNPGTAEGRIGTAKVDTRAQAKEDAQRRDALARKRQHPQSRG